MSLSVAILLSLTKVYKKIEITQSLMNCLGGLNALLRFILEAYGSIFGCKTGAWWVREAIHKGYLGSFCRIRTQ